MQNEEPQHIPPLDDLGADFPSESKLSEFLPCETTPTFGDSLSIYLISGLLLITLGATLQYLQLFSGLFISQIAFIAGPAVLFAVLRHYNLPQSFSLRPIRLKTALLAVLIACSAFVLVMLVAALQELLVQRSPQYIELWEKLMQEFRQAPLLLTFGVISVLPAICEELLFRGFLLKGLRKKLPDMPAVILVGVLFGLFHLDFYRFLPVSLLGILFGYLVVRTGSIFPAMLAHGVNNAITLLLSQGASHTQNAEQAKLEDLLSVEGILGVLPVVLVAVFVFCVALRALPLAEEEYPDCSQLPVNEL